MSSLAAGMIALAAVARADCLGCLLPALWHGRSPVVSGRSLFKPVSGERDLRSYFRLAASLMMAEIELPDLRTTLLNCSSDSLRRRRRILTCTLLARFSELRKSTGFCLFICFFRDRGRTGATRRALHRSGREGTVPLLAKILSPPNQHSLQSDVPSLLVISDHE